MLVLLLLRVGMLLLRRPLSQACQKHTSLHQLPKVQNFNMTAHDNLLLAWYTCLAVCCVRSCFTTIVRSTSKDESNDYV
jgi:hypothetical protein